MRKILDRSAFILSTGLNQMNFRIPVLREWPSLSKVNTGIYWRVIRPIVVNSQFKLAERYRKKLDNVNFIGVTGSAGKTMTKELITVVLTSTGEGTKSPGTMNEQYVVANTIRLTKSSHKFCVIEFSASAPGYLDQSLELVKPQVGVVTTIGTDHFKAFHSQEAIAVEKAKLVSSLPTDGVAVLNADDPLVMGMHSHCRGRVMTYGVSEDADLKAKNIRSAWPDRLSFTVTYGGESQEVQTLLCGTHWVTSVLAAIGVGLASGVSLETAARAVGSVKPFKGRMQPVSAKDGVTFIRDDWKAPWWTFQAVFDFLKSAGAKRKIIIIGTISDFAGPGGPMYKQITNQALEVADFVIFIGPSATHGFKAMRNLKDKVIWAFETQKSAFGFLNRFLEKGDLVLLKGSAKADHLGRIIQAREDTISCWRSDCGKDIFCENCSLLRADVGRLSNTVNPRLPKDKSKGSKNLMFSFSQLDGPIKCIVGIGNPEEKYQQTPHNIGYHVLDLLAKQLGQEWTKEENALLAQAEWEGSKLLLVKPLMGVNQTGPVLRQLSDRFSFDPTNCVLVQDDADLPFGKVRSRERGSDGGHKGVLSVLLTFQTDEIARVKVGLKKTGENKTSSEYLLTPFNKEDFQMIQSACKTAVERVLMLTAATQTSNTG